MNTVLLLAYECAPYHRPGSTIGAQRPFQFSKHLPVFGWRSIVLCCDFKSRYSLDNKSDWQLSIGERIDLHLKEWDQKNESVIIPLPSLQYASLTDRIWLHSVAKDLKTGAFSAKPGLLNRLKRPIATFLKLFSGDHSQSWQEVVAYAGTIISQRLKLDMIIAEHGPDASLYVARKLNRKLSIPYLVDFRDPALLAYPRYIRSIARFHLRKLIKFSAGTINVTPFWVTKDRSDFNRPAYFIPNGFDPEEYYFLDMITPNLVFTLATYGNISFPGDIDILFKALKKLEVEQVNFTFQYYGSLSALVHQKANEFGLLKYVQSWAVLPRELVLKALHKVDMIVLFSLDQKLSSDPYLEKGYYPAKIFEIFGLKRPFVIVPGDGGQLDDLTVNSGQGKVAQDENILAELILDEVKVWRKKGRRVPERKEGFVDQFTRDKQSKALADIMSKYLIIVN